MTRRVTQSDGQTVTSSYGPIRMPVEYRSGMGLQSMFWVPWSLAARLLVPYGLVPSPMFRGRAIPVSASSPTGIPISVRTSR